MKRIILASVSAFALFSATGALAATGDNNSFINQTGGVNDAAVYQSGAENDSSVTQTGTSGKALIQQVTQESGFGTRTRGAGGVDVASGDTVRSNFSNVSQSGDSDINSYQQGDLNRSRISQSGDLSKAKLDQRGIFNNSEISQSGGSTADVGQGGNYGDNNSIVSQSGGGRANVIQSADTTAPTFYPTNDSLVVQTSNSDAFVNQLGQQNDSDIYQVGASTGARAEIVQQNTAGSPAMNTAYTYQESNSDAYTLQQGQGNTANTYQYAGSDNSTSNIYQQSNGNTANVFQYSTGNTSNVFQNGTGGNIALVSQN